MLRRARARQPRRPPRPARRLVKPQPRPAQHSRLRARQIQRQPRRPARLIRTRRPLLEQLRIRRLLLPARAEAARRQLLRAPFPGTAALQSRVPARLIRMRRAAQRLLLGQQALTRTLSPPPAAALEAALPISLQPALSRAPTRMLPIAIPTPRIKAKVTPTVCPRQLLRCHCSACSA